MSNSRTITTSELSRRIGFQVGVDFLKSCGVIPALDRPNATHWLESDFPKICAAIAAMLSQKAKCISGYTPGPWEIEIHPGRQYFIPKIWSFSESGELEDHIARIEDARLACAAPDMLEALQELSRYFAGEYANDPRCDDEIYRDKGLAERLALNVIAKATGKTNTQEQ